MAVDKITMPTDEEMKKVETVVKDFAEIMQAHGLNMPLTTLAAAKLCGLILSVTPKSVNPARHMFMRKVLHHTIDISCAEYSHEKPTEASLMTVQELVAEFRKLSIPPQG